MKEPFHPNYNLREPEIQEDLHRPVGASRPREIKSQIAQLKSAHRHGTNKGIKYGMSKKTGHFDYDD